MTFRQARERAGISMSEAAEKIGVTTAAVSLWETGKGFPLVSNLVKMAALYGVGVDELLAPCDGGGEKT